MKLSNLIIEIGLVFDIVGAFFLAKGFIAKKIQSIINESGTHFDRNKAFQDSLIIQKFEAIAGMIFLLVGFSFQLVGNFLFCLIKLSMTVIILLLFIPFFLGLLSSRIIKHKSIKSVLKIEAILHKDELANYNAKSLDVCGDCLKISRDANESDDKYKERIRNKIHNILRKPI